MKQTEPMDNIQILHEDTTMIPCRILIAPLEIDNERLLVMIFRKMTEMEGKTDNLFDQASGLLFIEELNRNRLRIQVLEESLNNPVTINQEPDITTGLNNIDSTLAQMEKTLINSGQGLDKKKLGVQVMILALKYWEESTGLTKSDLAHRSNLWKVYMTKDGHERTQTLDKYLDLEKLPKIPRWRKVYQTVDYVLLTCQTSSKLRNELELSLSKLRLLK